MKLGGVGGGKLKRPSTCIVSTKMCMKLRYRSRTLRHWATKSALFLKAIQLNLMKVSRSLQQLDLRRALWS